MSSRSRSAIHVDSSRQIRMRGWESGNGTMKMQIVSRTHTYPIGFCTT